MSEYQCYEFQAIDRPFDGAARTALRDIIAHGVTAADLCL